ncbi:MAG: imelysin family protein, partial [Verrucomicrobiota bacterium]
IFSAQTSPAQPNPAEKTFSWEVMLRNTGRNVIEPGYNDLLKNCRDLTNALAQLPLATNQTSLELARKTWLATADAANRMRCFQIGPVAARSCLPTFYYWQVLPARIEGAAEATNSFAQSFIDELGATTKGLFAIEYLIFDRNTNQPATEGNDGSALELLSRSPKRGAFLLAVARDLESKACLVAGDWNATDGQGALSRFVAAGHESVNLLVNQLAMITEDTAEKHLNFVLVLPLPIERQLYRVERSRSGSSLEGVLATLAGFENIYRGSDGFGLDDAISRLNPALEKRLDEQLAGASAALQALGSPLEQAVVNNRPLLEKAYEQVRVLEILIKVDVVSALGVTLTFSSADGD